MIEGVEFFGEDVMDPVLLDRVAFSINSYKLRVCCRCNMVHYFHFYLFGTTDEPVVAEFFVGDQGNHIIDAVKLAIRMIAIVEFLVK